MQSENENKQVKTKKTKTYGQLLRDSRRGKKYGKSKKIIV